METFEMMAELLRPEFAILIAFAYALGSVIHTSEALDNKFIPLILLGVTAVLGATYLVIIEGANGFALALFMGAIQGAISGFVSTGIYEFKKQTQKSLE